MPGVALKIEDVVDVDRDTRLSRELGQKRNKIEKKGQNTQKADGAGEETAESWNLIDC